MMILYKFKKEKILFLLFRPCTKKAEVETLCSFRVHQKGIMENIFAINIPSFLEFLEKDSSEKFETFSADGS